MGIKEDEFLDPNAISDTYRCPVCFEVFEEPVFCGGRPCQHVFCRECVTRALEATTCQTANVRHSTDSDEGSDEEVQLKIGQCPSCRAPMRVEDLQPHQVMRSLLDELTVRCRRACGWTGRRDALAAHESPGPQQCPVLKLESARAELALLSGAGGELRERDKRIRVLEQRVEEQDQHMVDLGRQLLAREVYIAELESRLQEKDRNLTQREMELQLLRRGRLVPAPSGSPSLSPQPSQAQLQTDEGASGGQDLWL
eukprot:TRINITY_DN19069_c0_g1_i1.p1 TRINITY_DN19069_c0_g1~~TRINITY_DN19069_c0_g1_i1.p1  ORF type:complete len:255 (-),score=40.23 TRINITY_DN19069_c0_g1_i1:142-906(-)